MNSRVPVSPGWCLLDLTRIEEILTRQRGMWCQSHPLFQFISFQSQFSSGWGPERRQSRRGDVTTSGGAKVPSPLYATRICPCLVAAHHSPGFLMAHWFPKLWGCSINSRRCYVGSNFSDVAEAGKYWHSLKTWGGTKQVLIREKVCRGRGQS